MQAERANTPKTINEHALLLDIESRLDRKRGLFTTGWSKSIDAFE